MAAHAPKGIPGTFRIDADGLKALARVLPRTEGGNMDEIEANARLITAAPDYYQAVEQLLAHYQAGGDGWWKGIEMLKAAHAKASPK